MKQIIKALILTSFLVSASSWASVDKSKGSKELQAKIDLMLLELETGDQSPEIEKLILTNIVNAYSNSNIDDRKLKIRLAGAVLRLNPVFSKKERTEISSKLARIR
jgi:hypothetical protein